VVSKRGLVWSQQGKKLVGTGAVGNPVYQGWSVTLSGDLAGLPSRRAHHRLSMTPVNRLCAANREHRKIRDRLKSGEDVFGGLGETAVDILDKLQ